MLVILVGGRATGQRPQGGPDWLVLAVMAFNLTRAAATLTGPVPAKATTATIRRKLINLPARIAHSARRITLHLPQQWPWATGRTTLYTRGCGPPTTNNHPAGSDATKTRTPEQTGRRIVTPARQTHQKSAFHESHEMHRWIEA
jgi:hypothetical protein